MTVNKRKSFLYLVYTSLAIVVAIGSWNTYKRYFSQHIDPSHILYPIRGIDISNHNGDIDFNAVKRSGIKFVILKATEGSAFTDKKFTDNYTRAKNAGLLVGVYHFFRFDCDGKVQANHFLNTIKGLELDLPLAIDVEEWGNSKEHEREAVIKQLRSAIDHIELRHYNVMIYTNKKGYRKFISTDFSQYPLWICSFSDPPGPDCWYMWQYTHRGKVDGVKGNVDINILNHR